MPDRDRALRELAESHGVMLSYEDITGARREASTEGLLAVLRSLGEPLERPEEAPDALRRRRQALRTRILPPVAVSCEGEETEVPVRTTGDAATLRCGIELEGGDRLPLRPPPDLPAVGWSDVEGRTVVTRRLRLPPGLRPGYHTLWVETGGGEPGEEKGASRIECRVIRAPRRAWTPPPPTRRWGLFLPLYALRTARDWGAGDFTDLEAFLAWTVEAGGHLVGTLPLLASYLDEPYEPSPYAPVSRLFWNELYLDPTRVPGWEGAGRSEEERPGLEADLRELRGREWVDYRRIHALKRRLLEPLAERWFHAGGERDLSFVRFLRERRQVGDYARFRAATERRRSGWPAWPLRMREGDLRPGDYDPAAVRYHLFVQWAADRQLTALARRTVGEGLYLDFPIGTHPAGYDTWRHRALFASGVATGAPPDDFFREGQDWGVPPLHPERLREHGYEYLIAAFRHSLRHAGALRIDHIMGLHRLFWVPEGGAPADGVYVRYRSEELWGILCLESHREQTLLVGEDLGTVPPEVREAMAGHGVDGMHILQYQARPESPPVPPAPARALAAPNTHDMFPFAAWWEGTDVERRRELGLLDAPAAAAERARRAALRRMMASFLQSEGHLGDRVTTGTALSACLEHLAAGASRTCVPSLEDLWLESRPQNVPGTGGERPNWRRRAARRLEELSRDPAVERLLRRMREARTSRQPEGTARAGGKGSDAAHPGRPAVERRSARGSPE